MGSRERVFHQPRERMNFFYFVASLASLAVVQADESWSGSGTFACYGDMTVTMDKSGSNAEGPIDGEGSIDCIPAWGSAAAPPQGIIADGDDGSHWVTVDDKGLGDCNRILTLDDGEQTRKFCGYASCTGYINLHC